MSARRKSMSFKTFVLLVILTTAVVVGAVFAVLYFSGTRLLTYKTSEHGTIRFIGKVDSDGKPTSGKVYYSDGSKATLTYEGDTLEFSDGSSVGGRIVRLDYEDGGVYLGEINTLLRDGSGIMKFSGGDVYEGGFEYGLMSGKGVYSYANGDVYTGEFSSGVKNGSGSYTWAEEDGKTDSYVGEFKNNLKDGSGKYCYGDGTVYEGEYKNDVKNGNGKLTFASGAVYEGEFKNDMRSGKGKYTFTNGDVYEGDFYMNTITGYGTYHWADGSRADYTGYFKNGVIVTVDETETEAEKTENQ